MIISVPTPSPQLLRPSGTSSMIGGDLAPLPEELAAVRLTEEFIVIGKADHVGVDAHIDPSVQKRKMVKP